MSNDLDMEVVPSTKKRRKERDAFEKKSSKKRKRLEDTTHSDSPRPISQSRKKKRRRLEANDEEVISPSPAPAPATPPSAQRPSPESVELPSPRPSIPQQIHSSDGSKNQSINDQAVLGADEISNSTAESPFFVQRTSFYLPIPPIAQTTPLEAICAEHLSPMILTYSEQLKGVVISYSNVRFPKKRREQRGPGGAILSQSVDEYGVTYVWVMADFVLLRPQRNSWVWGAITVQSESHIGLVCWNLFNASIERARLPNDWHWVPGPNEGSRTKGRNTGEAGKENKDTLGCWVDAQGNAVEGPLRFRVWDFESSTVAQGRDRHFLSIEGTLQNDGEESDGGSDDGESDGGEGNDGESIDVRPGSEQAEHRLENRRRTPGSISGDERLSDDARSTENEPLRTPVEDSEQSDGDESLPAAEESQDSVL